MSLEGIQPIRVGGRLEYHVDSLWLLFDAIHLSSSDGLRAWVEIRWTGNVPRPRLLHFGTYNLMGSRTVSSIVNGALPAMPKGAGKSKEDLTEIVSACVYNTVQDLLEGDPAESLAQVEIAEDGDERYLLYPLVGATGATSLIAPGGSTKSFIALAAGLSVATGRGKFLSLKPRQTGPVLLLDWEADARTHAERMRALCSPYGIEPPDTLYYRSEKAPLFRSAASLAKIVDELGIAMVIVDSVMLARGGDAMGPEDTIRFYTALRELNRPCFLVDHKSREAVRKGWRGAFGSVVNDNSARLQWEIDAVEDNGPDDLAIKISQSKRNNVGKLSPMAFQIHFDNGKTMLEGVTFRAIDPTSVAGFHSTGQSASDEILSELKLAMDDGMTVNELAAATGKSANQIRARLAELLKQSRVEKREGKRGHRWYAAGWDQQTAVGDDLPDPM
jgi:hypothetical protein